MPLLGPDLTSMLLKKRVHLPGEPASIDESAATDTPRTLGMGGVHG